MGELANMRVVQLLFHCGIVKMCTIVITTVIIIAIFIITTSTNLTTITITATNVVIKVTKINCFIVIGDNVIAILFTLKKS